METVSPYSGVLLLVSLCLLSMVPPRGFSMRSFPCGAVRESVWCSVRSGVVLRGVTWSGGVGWGCAVWLGVVRLAWRGVVWCGVV